MDPITTIFFVVILIFSIMIHEISHGFAADRLGDPTPRQEGRLTLNPLKHLDWFGSVILPALLVISGTGFILGWAKPVRFNSFNLRDRKWGPSLIAIAGPASNIVIALVFGLILRFSAQIGIASAPFLFIASGIVFMNVLLAVFNLIPIPPLDGHHILFAVIPDKYQSFKKFLDRYSLILLLGVVFFVWPYIVPLVDLIYTLIVGSPFVL